MNNKSKINIKEYLPDIIILIGIAITLYFFLIPTRELLPSLSYEYTKEKVAGIMIIAIGINILIRRYMGCKNKKS